MVKQSTKNPVKKTAKKVDYEPNKMGFAVAAMSAVILVLVAVIATQG
jgi:DNA-binding LacI/PurR family transcriptional regulator